MDTPLGDYVGTEGWIAGDTRFVYIGSREGFRVSFDSSRPINDLNKVKHRLDSQLYRLHGLRNGITHFTEEVRTSYYAPKKAKVTGQ